MYVYQCMLSSVSGYPPHRRLIQEVTNGCIRHFLKVKYRSKVTETAQYGTHASQKQNKQHVLAVDANRLQTNH